MNLSKIAATVIVASCLTAGAVVDASAAIGRSSTTSSSARSSSVSSSAARSPTRIGGIGGTSSIGVRKPTITQPVAKQLQPAATSSASSSTYRSQPQYGSGYNNSNYNQQPNYNNNSNYAHPQNYSSGPSAAGTFAAAAGGSLVGSAVGNALFNNHNATPSTTIVNNGAPAAAPAAVATTPVTTVVDPVTGNTAVMPMSSNVAAMPATVMQQVPAAPVVVQQQKGYSLFSLIGDMLGFAIVALLALGIVFGGYMLFKRTRKFIEQEKQEAVEERAADPVQPFAPVGKFWAIQRAFSDADVVALKSQLGPDVVDELTANLEPTVIQISNVSSDVLLLTNTEFSVHYTFTDNNEQVNQVWHYEVHDGQWKLNGIENL